MIMIMIMIMIIIIIVIITFNQSAYITGLVFRIEQPCVTENGLKDG